MQHLFTLIKKIQVEAANSSVSPASPIISNILCDMEG